jgi:hypothetical protein
MDAEERAAANRMVAIGMEPERWGWYAWEYADGTLRDRTLFPHDYVKHNYAEGNYLTAGPVACDTKPPLYDRWFYLLPDIFSTSPDGAMARDRAEEWLYRDGWTTWRAEEHEFDSRKFFRVAIHKGSRGAHGNGDTIGEARANAIAAAFMALKNTKEV